MASFFNRLFQYRATESRNPREDFLSELLADFLNRAPIEDAHLFISTCFIPRQMKSQYHSIAGGRRANVRTQVQITDRKRLDLLIEIENQPVAIVENKLWAAFQSHGKATPSESDEKQGSETDDIIKEEKEIEYDHQLVTYGRWLESVPKPKDWPGVLCVLTHGAQPPSDFVYTNTERYRSIPHLQLWRNLYGELKKALGKTTKTQAFLLGFSLDRNFAAFWKPTQ